jgi:hypothetical protein
MRTSPELTDVQIAVASSHIRKMDRVVRRLTEIGMLLDRIDPETGVVVGRIDPLRFELLKRVPGVGASERYGEVRVSTQRRPNR